MKVIFLDVDGVIKPMNSDEPIHGFNANCMAWLSDIVKQTGAKIVLSTSWRECPSDLSFLENGLNKWDGLWENVIGLTPELYHLSHEKWDNYSCHFVNETDDWWTGKRGHEINEWMKINKNLVKKAVILDDDPLADQGDRLSNNLIMFGECDPAVGLNKEISQKAIDFLNK